MLIIETVGVNSRHVRYQMVEYYDVRVNLEILLLQIFPKMIYRERLLETDIEEVMDGILSNQAAVGPY